MLGNKVVMELASCERRVHEAWLLGSKHMAKQVEAISSSQLCLVPLVVVVF